MYLLAETELMKISSRDTETHGAEFVIEPLSPGYGVTLGNAIRRVLLSSLEGSAVSAVKIDGITHEFTNLENMQEDIVELILNLKSLPVKLYGDESTTLVLDAKGPGEIKAKDFKTNSDVEIIDPEHFLMTLNKGGKIKAEVTIEKGRGYVSAEKRTDEKAPLGTILVDSIFTPIKKVNFEVENTRVGSVTNFDKLIINITTNGSISPFDAFKNANQILVDHFTIVKDNIEVPAEPKVKAKAKAKTKPKAEKPKK